MLFRTGSPDDGAQKLELEYNTFDLGVLYNFTNGINLGLMLKNIYGISSKKEDDDFSLPSYATLGISSKKDGYTFSFDNEIIHGRYGAGEKKTARFWLLRGGVEKDIDGILKLRLGLIYPIVAYTSTVGDMREDIPSPKIGGAGGVGAEFDRFIIDFTVYGDPAKSYVEQQKVVTSVGTIVLKF
jgi:hypothetical protein